MRLSIKMVAYMLLLVAAASFAVLPGCGSKTVEAPAESTGSDAHDHDHDHDDHEHEEDNAHEHDDHDHGEEHDHEHDHGEAHEHDDDDDQAGHSHEAPRGGTLVALGDHVAHFEVMLDADSGKLTVYVMDGHVENPVRLEVPAISLSITPDGGKAQEVELAAVANALTGETVGDTSQFEATVEALKGADRFEAKLDALSVRGVEMTGIAFVFPEGNEG